MKRYPTDTNSKHSSGCALLHTMATLCGYVCILPRGFPDGSMPDVIHVNVERRGLFIGDAKASETPGNSETAVRLTRYVRWLAIHIQDRKAIGTFALAVSSPKDSAGWAALLKGILHEAGLDGGSVRVKRVSKDQALVFSHLTGLATRTPRASSGSAIHSLGLSNLHHNIR